MLRMLKYHKIILLWFKDPAKYGKTIGNVCTPFWHMEETYDFSFALFFLHFSLLYFIIAQTTFVDQSMLTQSYNWNCNTHNLSKQHWWCTNIIHSISKYMKLWKIIFHIAWFDIILPYQLLCMTYYWFIRYCFVYLRYSWIVKYSNLGVERNYELRRMTSALSDTILF